MTGKIIDKRIIPLAVGGLGIGTTEFAIMGLLPDMARSLNVSIPDAGHFISAYALGVVIGAPLFIAYLMNYPPKKVLIWLMVLFTVFNAVTAVTANYPLMIAARFLTGLPHGAFFGVSTVVATRLADEGRKASFIAMIFSGLTIANLAVVPLTAYIGHQFHWSWAFILISIIGLITILLIHLWLPDLAVENNADESGKLSFLKRTQSWYVLLIIAIGFGGLFAWLSYITPLMTEVSGFSSENVAYIMVLVGGGMVVGNFLGGYLTDRAGAGKVSIALLSLMVLTLLSVFFFSTNQAVSLLLTFLYGVLSFSLVSPVNIMMLKEVPDAKMMSAAFIQSAFNISNALGAYLGGIPLIYGLSYSFPSLVGAAMTFIGLIICLRYTFKFAVK